MNWSAMWLNGAAFDNTRGPIRTFLDSGVLITGYNGLPGLQERALAILEDPKRIFLGLPEGALQEAAS